MPASGPPALILSAAGVAVVVVVAFAVLWLTRLVVRFAAEPDRGGRGSRPARARGLERDR